MADEQLKVFVDVVTNRAVSELKKLKKATEDTGEELEDTRTEAQKVADRIDKVTESMVADMKAAEKAADALAQALGPEMSAKIGQAGIDEFVSDMKRAGLTAKDVEADADRLAQTLKNIDQAKAPIRDVQTHIKKVGDETDNSRSVMANFTGNAIQDLPIVSGAMGPLNMAIGQFAEYAVDGNIKLKNFLATAGAIGAASVLISQFASYFAEAGQKAEEAAQRAQMLATGVDDIVDSLYNLDEIGGDTVIDPLSQALTEGDQIAVQFVDNLGALELSVADAAKTISDIRKDPVTALKELAKRFGLSDEMAGRLAESIGGTGGSAHDAGLDFLELGAAAGYTDEELDYMDQTLNEVFKTAKGTDLNQLYTQFLNMQVAAGGLAAELVRTAEDIEGVAREDNPQLIYDRWIKLAEAERAIADEAKAAKERFKDIKTEIGRLGLKADTTRLALEQMLNVLTNEQTWNDIQLGLLGMEERLGQLKSDYESGKITAQQYWLETRQEILGAQTDLFGYLTEVLNIPKERAMQIVTSFDPNNVNATISSIDELIRRGLTINGRPLGASEVTGPGGSSMTPTNPTNPNATPGGTTVIVNGALDPVAVADQIDRILRENGYRNGTG